MNRLRARPAGAGRRRRWGRVYPVGGEADVAPGGGSAAGADGRAKKHKQTKLMEKKEIKKSAPPDRSARHPEGTQSGLPAPAGCFPGHLPAATGGARRRRGVRAAEGPPKC